MFAACLYPFENGRKTGCYFLNLATLTVLIFQEDIRFYLTVNPAVISRYISVDS